MSRTAKRRTVNDYSVLANDSSRTMFSDQELLIELQNLRGQSLEASYRRKLEAIALLLRQRQRSNDGSREETAYAGNIVVMHVSLLPISQTASGRLPEPIAHPLGP